MTKAETYIDIRGRLLLTPATAKVHSNQMQLAKEGFLSGVLITRIRFSFAQAGACPFKSCIAHL